MSDESKSGEDIGETNKNVGTSISNPSDKIDLQNHCFECRSCGYVYDPKDGIKKLGIPSGTAFLSFDQAHFRCPVCRGGFALFRDIGPREKPSGFEENLEYGFGINNMTAGQKNVLIFGGLALAVACFLSLYSLH